MSTQAILATLQRWDLHPVVDHFTIGLLIVGVLLDLVASTAPTRIWLRYTALTLMILGAIAAGGSYFTGGLEANRIFDAMSEPAKEIFKWHARLGEYLAVAFGVLAVWRILIQAVDFFAGTRTIYIIVAIIAAGVLLRVGSLGGKLVYEYGVGTALMSPAASPTETAAPPPAAVPNSALPTVSVPTGTPTPMVFTPVPATPVPTKAPDPTAAPSPQPTY